MGCDIHSYIEVKQNGKWKQLTKGGVTAEEFAREHEGIDKTVHPFAWRSYGIFAFLAGVRNYSDIPCIVDSRGLPGDVSNGVMEEYKGWESDAHTASWLTAKELSTFDYSQKIIDHRAEWGGTRSSKPSDWNEKTWSEFLGPDFMKQVSDLRELGNPDEVRIVFWFDN